MNTTAIVAQPRYLQIANRIVEKIRSGLLSTGDQLPTKRQLAAELGVSRMTVRQALAVLTEQGLINSQHGIGNFVTRPMLEQPVDILVGFSDNMLKKGIQPGTNFYNLKSTGADQLLARELQVPLGDPVIAVRRLRLADKMPAALDTLISRNATCPAWSNMTWSIAPSTPSWQRSMELLWPELFRR